MKKKLEADLVSIAHRVLQMKNKSDINQLCVETRKLYEKLSILQFVEEHFEGAKPTIGQAEVVTKMKQFFEENHLSDVKLPSTNLEIVADTDVQNEIIEEKITEKESTPIAEVKFKEIEPIQESATEELIKEEPVKLQEIAFFPAFELDVEPEEIPETPKKAESIQISFEELLGVEYKEAHFVKVDHNKANSLDFDLPKETSIQMGKVDNLSEIQVSTKDIASKNVVLVDKPTTGIPIGLNDKIAFVKHLFANSDEDYNRVMNQLITFNSFDEAKNFIEDMVKPDYSDWQGKEEYEQRFIEIIEKKFA